MPPEDPKHTIVPVDHDPFANHQTVPVEHDPFADPSAGIRAVGQLEQRIYQLELALMQAVQQITSTLAGMSGSVAELHAKHDKLKATMAAPKRIVRDEDGRPTGFVSDLTLH
jgi:hypothetical protein